MSIKDTRKKLKTSQQLGDNLEKIQQLGDNNYKEHTTKIGTQDSFKKLQQKKKQKNGQMIPTGILRQGNLNGQQT